jgi:hypothetical protein
MSECDAPICGRVTQIGHACGGRACLSERAVGGCPDPHASDNFSPARRARRDAPCLGAAWATRSNIGDYGTCEYSAFFHTEMKNTSAVWINRKVGRGVSHQPCVRGMPEAIGFLVTGRVGGSIGLCRQRHLDCDATSPPSDVRSHFI